jgi:hypothetical protein
MVRLIIIIARAWGKRSEKVAGEAMARVETGAGGSKDEISGEPGAWGPALIRGLLDYQRGRSITRSLSA